MKTIFQSNTNDAPFRGKYPYFDSCHLVDQLASRVPNSLLQAPIVNGF
ncbi:MAG: hypothetical protein ABSE48_05360 [Verrucomicrobiota bacterium]